MIMPTRPKKKRIRLYGLQGGKDPAARRERPRSDDRYHTARWTRLSRAYRNAHPLCEECLRKGIYTPAEVVDHIRPAPLCSEEDFWDENNWQSLCEACNIAKGNRDKAYIQGRRK